MTKLKGSEVVGQITLKSKPRLPQSKHHLYSETTRNKDMEISTYFPRHNRTVEATILLFPTQPKTSQSSHVIQI